MDCCHRRDELLSSQRSGAPGALGPTNSLKVLSTSDGLRPFPVFPASESCAVLRCVAVDPNEKAATGHPAAAEDRLVAVSWELTMRTRVLRASARRTHLPEHLRMPTFATVLNAHMSMCEFLRLAGTGTRQNFFSLYRKKYLWRPERSINAAMIPWWSVGGDLIAVMRSSQRVDETLLGFGASSGRVDAAMAPCPSQ